MGTFPTLGDVVDAVAHILQGYSDFKLPLSVTIH